MTGDQIGLPSLRHQHSANDPADRRRRPALSDRAWRAVWREVLDEPARRRIRGATRRGDRLPDADEAAVAIERALRLRRGALVGAALGILVSGVLVGIGFAVVDLPAAATFWWLIAVYASMIVVHPLVALWRVRQLDRVIAANRGPTAAPPG